MNTLAFRVVSNRGENTIIQFKPSFLLQAQSHSVSFCLTSVTAKRAHEDTHTHTGKGVGAPPGSTTQKRWRMDGWRLRVRVCRERERETLSSNWLVC